MNPSNKNDFIQMISHMTPEDITEFIREKGKKPKLVKPFIKVYDFEKENDSNE